MEESGHKLLSEVMEKMIDSQISNTQALTSLRDSLNNTSERIKSIESFFGNGFRSDIKKIIHEIRDTNEQLKESDEKLSELKIQNDDLMKQLEKYQVLGRWIKVISGLVLAIAAVVAAVIKFI